MSSDLALDGAARRARLRSARLYLVCDSRPGGRDLLDFLRASIAGGVDIVQLRDKRLDDDELLVAARAAGALCRRLGALFVVNDRPAVALAARADGVHVGQEDMLVDRVRELVGPDMLVGLSTHSPADIDALAGGRFAATGSAADSVENSACHVDYIGVGPVYATPTKPGRPATGAGLVSYAAANARAPFFAIGGIDANNVRSVLQAGARRVAVVRALVDAADPAGAARRLCSALDEAGEQLEMSLPLM